MWKYLWGAWGQSQGLWNGVPLSRVWTGAIRIELTSMTAGMSGSFLSAFKNLSLHQRLAKKLASGSYALGSLDFLKPWGASGE